MSSYWHGVGDGDGEGDGDGVPTKEEDGVRDGDRVSRIEVAASPIRIAVAPLQPAVAAPTVAAPAAGVAPPPAGDAPGSGNAAFRAAIEDKIRSMNR